MNAPETSVLEGTLFDSYSIFESYCSGLIVKHGYSNDLTIDEAHAVIRAVKAAALRLGRQPDGSLFVPFPAMALLTATIEEATNKRGSVQAL